MERSSTTRSVASGSVTTTIVEKIADREDVAPTELRPPLHAVVDPDALNAVFARTGGGLPRTSGRIEFEYAGYDVVVHADGRVSVTDRETA